MKSIQHRLVLRGRYLMMRFSLALALAVLVITGCAPDVIQATQQAQREQVSKLTTDLGTPDQIRAEMRGAGMVSGVLANVLMQPPPANIAAKPDYAQVIQSSEQALLGEKRRLDAVANSRTDDEYVGAIADLCTPDGLNDAETTGELANMVATRAPVASVQADPTKLANFQKAQGLTRATAQLMAEIQSRCREGNAAVVEAAAQAQAQAAEAHRKQGIIFGLLAARLSAPRTNVNVSQTQYGD